MATTPTPMADRVRVAVRVQPFSQREKNAGSKCVISMHSRTTTIHCPKNTEQTKTFTFDLAYWSHNEFQMEKDGVFTIAVPTSKFAGQREVFHDLGRAILDSTWQGYNATLLAYGQTGSGKSYSMIGFGANKGLIPKVCEELFQAIENRERNQEYQVTFSMLEIHNEQVRDLLSRTKKPGGLKVRKDTQLGFVDGLRSVPCENYAQIERLMEQGTRVRTTPSTNMNASSSRSHMVITLQFKQGMVPPPPHHLQGQHGFFCGPQSGVGMGTFPSQTLLVCALADTAAGKRVLHIPYRDSVLTRLLQPALGGNSRTALIAAISPADICYEETLSTLRYAERAKKVRNKAVVNTSALMRYGAVLLQRDALVRALLPTRHSPAHAGTPLPPTRQVPPCAAQRAGRPHQLTWAHLLEQACEEWQQHHVAIAQVSFTVCTWECNPPRSRTPLSAQPPLRWMAGVRASSVNWTWDMCRTLMFSAEVGRDGTAAMGSEYRGLDAYCRARGNWALWGARNYAVYPGVHSSHVGCDRERSSLPPVNKHYTPTTTLRPKSHRLQTRFFRISDKHASFTNLDGKVTVIPYNKCKVVINGVPITTKTKLQHLDRIILGSNSAYLYIGFPSERANEDLSRFDYDFFQLERAAAQGMSVDKLGSGHGGKRADPSVLAVFQDYIKLLLLVAEVNMSEELRKGLIMELKVKNLASSGFRGYDLQKEVMVKVTNQRTHEVWVWSKAKFINRKFLMEELYQRLLDGEDSHVAQEDDPFWDPVEVVHLGSAHIWLQSLAYCMQFEEQVEFLNCNGLAEAVLHIHVTPCSLAGACSEEDVVIDPLELLGKRMDFQIHIEWCLGAKWLKEDAARGIQMGIYDLPHTLYIKPVWKIANPLIESVQFTALNASQEFLNYLQTNALIVDLWGLQEGCAGLSCSHLDLVVTAEGHVMVDTKKISTLVDAGQTPSNQISELHLTLLKLEQDTELLRNINRALREANMFLKDSLDKTDSCQQAHKPPNTETGTGMTKRLPPAQEGKQTSTLRAGCDRELATVLKVFYQSMNMARRQFLKVRHYKPPISNQNPGSHIINSSY
ncbi:LOW QUALITY PROTEIN: kinesin-like protein KIF28P [Rhynchonycteris naso]